MIKPDGVADVSHSLRSQPGSGGGIADPSSAFTQLDIEKELGTHVD